MDAYESIITKLDMREFAREAVPGAVIGKILEAARATGSSMNTQHWRFILVRERDDIQMLAADSTSGRWVAGADFAIMILTDPKIPGSAIDPGRVLQDMGIAAWSFGVASGLFTGFRRAELRRDFGIPPEMEVSVVVGFGYPAKKVVGKKDRKPLEDIVFSGRYGNKLGPKDLA